MTGIFEDRCSAKRLRWYRKHTSPRHGAPDGETGTLLPVRVLLAATPRASIALGHLVAFQPGWSSCSPSISAAAITITRAATPIVAAAPGCGSVTGRR